MKLLLSLLLLCSGPADSLLVVSWNVENFLDYRTDSTGRYTKSRFYTKCNQIAKTLLVIADREGKLPDAVALMEVGNRFVLERLLSDTPLRKLDYSIIHFDSPDKRGIDCALLWRRSTMRLCSAGPKHLMDSAGTVMPTRDILLAEFDSLAILVNHHPSKVGENSEGRRNAALARMNGIMDSLQVEGCSRILSVGDFNEDLWHDGSSGTIKYNGAWEKIDGHFSRGAIRVKETVFADPLLSEPDRRFGGVRPRRCFSGPRWIGGVSDHYPIIEKIYYICKN